MAQKSLYNIDMALCQVLIERFNIVKQIGHHKKKHAIEPLSPARWKQVIAHKRALCETLNLNQNFIEAMFTHIHRHALSLEDKS